MTENGALQHLAEVQGIGVGAALQLLQSRYALVIVQLLMTGPHRLVQLHAGSRARSAVTLRARLNELQQAGVIRRQDDLYALTSLGRRLDALVMAIERFHALHPGVDPADLLAALQRRYAMAIMRALIAGELGFNELQRVTNIPSATTLSRRLTDLEALELLEKTVYSIMPPRTLYRHSPLGAAFNRVIGHIVLWGEGLPPDQLSERIALEGAGRCGLNPRNRTKR